MKTYDYIFIYEVKNRELDCVLLLKYELERRGYSVAIVETWQKDIIKSKPIRAKVAVCYALYDDDIFKFIRQFVCDCRKYVNLQWEQIRTNSSENLALENCSIGFYGMARKAVHISWGQNNYRKLTERYNINNRLVKICGNMTLDFLREEFRDYYESRESIIANYGMNDYEKIYLFVSSFSYPDIPETIFTQKTYQNQGFSVNEHREISRDSRIEILKWFERELVKYPKTVVIYRPHPAEKTSKILKDMEIKYSNFRVIGELSIKQWIVIADKVYLWWSTSIAEVYSANKNCEILRPIPIPYMNELQIYNEASFVKSYEDFDENFIKDTGFPIDRKNLEKFYEVDNIKPSYLRVCDVLEEVLKDDTYIIDNIDELDNPYKTWRIHNIKRRIMNIIFGYDHIYNLLRHILGNRVIKSGKTVEAYREDYLYASSMIEKNCCSSSEIDDISNRIREKKTVERRFENRNEENC